MKGLIYFFHITFLLFSFRFKKFIWKILIQIFPKDFKDEEIWKKSLRFNTWYHWTIKNCPGNKGKSDIVDPEIAHLLHLEIL